LTATCVRSPASLLAGCGDVGNRKGLPVFTREATIGYGVRLAFW